MIVLLLLFLSIGAGMLLQKWPAARHIDKSATATVWLLIFVFGLSLGSNEEIVSDFSRFGLTAVAIALAGVAGSVVAARIFQWFTDRGKEQ